MRIVLFFLTMMMMKKKKKVTTTKECSEFQSMPVIATLLNRKLILVRTDEFRQFRFIFALGKIEIEMFRWAKICMQCQVLWILTSTRHFCIIFQKSMTVYTKYFKKVTSSKYFLLTFSNNCCHVDTPLYEIIQKYFSP